MLPKEVLYMVQSHEAKPSIFIPVKSIAFPEFFDDFKDIPELDDQKNKKTKKKKNRCIFIKPIISLGKDDIVCTCEQKLLKSDNFVFIFWRQDWEKFGFHAFEVIFS